MIQLPSSPISNKSKYVDFNVALSADVAVPHSSGSPLTGKLVPTCSPNVTQVSMIQEVWMEVSWCEPISSHVCCCVLN